MNKFQGVSVYKTSFHLLCVSNWFDHKIFSKRKLSMYANMKTVWWSIFKIQIFSSHFIALMLVTGFMFGQSYKSWQTAGVCVQFKISTKFRLMWYILWLILFVVRMLNRLNNFQILIWIIIVSKSNMEQLTFIFLSKEKKIFIAK